MADNAQPNRPLSPHLSIYRVQMNSTMSIFHRLAGIGLAVSAMVLVWWFLAAATGAAYFRFVDGLLTSGSDCWCLRSRPGRFGTIS